MSDGEELPPVVAVLDIEDDSFLTGLERDVAALRDAVGEIEALLASLDIGAGLSASLSGADLASLNSDELAQGLGEQMAGVGAALAQDIGSELGSELASAGADGGQALAEGVAEGAAGLGDAVAADLGEELVSPLQAAGAEAAAALEEGMASGLSGLGTEVGHAIEHATGSADAAAIAAGLQIGAVLSGGLGTGLAAGSSLAAVAIAGPLTAASVDAASQAGAAAGGALMAGVGDGASGGTGRTASRVASALQASLTDALTEGGAGAASGLLAGIAQGASQGAGRAAQKVAEALQPPLESSMTQVGASAGDAFNAGFASATGSDGAGGSGAGEGGGPNFIDFAGDTERVVEQQAAELGDRAGLAYRTAWEGRYGAIPRGADISDVLAMANQQDAFVPNLAEGQNAWILASKTGAKEAADAAWQAYGQELSGLVISPAQFAAMTDSGVELWAQEVAARAAASGEGFASAFADAITMSMAGIEWESLTGVQASALGNAMRGIVQEAAPEAEAEMEVLGQDAVASLRAGVTSTGSAVADALIAQIVEARQAVTDELVQLAMTAADEGTEAGGAFARFFSEAASGVRMVFTKDPEKAAAAGAEAGRDYANAMVDELEAQLGETPEVAAEEGAAAGGAFGRFFSSAASGVLAVFARDPAKAAGAETGIEFADAMVEQLEARLAMLAEAGDPAFAQAIEQQLEAQLNLAAAEVAAAYEQQLADDLAAAEAEAAAQVAEMRTDLNADAMFSNLAQTLPAEFVDAFATMRAGIALTDEEFAQFSESGQRQIYALATLLETQGVQAADEFAQALSTKVFNERLDPASLMAGAGGVASELDSLGGEAEKTTSKFGGMASMMSGPMGMAAYGLMMALPLLGGAVKDLGNALDPTKAQLLDVQQLQQAIGGDGGTAGLTTAAFVATSSAANGMATSAAQAGVSLETWTEAALGNTQAQDTVTAAIDKLNQSQLNQQVTTDENTKQTGKFSGELQDAQSTVAAAADSTNRLTDANQKLQNSMYAEAGQVAAGIKATQAQDEATMRLALNQQIFSATLDGSYAKLQLQTQASTEAAIGLLNLGENQYSANLSMYNSVNAYTLAQQGAGSYNTVLSSLNGTENAFLSAAAGFTVALAGIGTAAKANGDSLDYSNVKGAQNIQVLTGVAQSAQTAAVDLYQNEVATKGATQAYSDANAKLAAEKQAFIEAADKAHLNKTEVQALADELFKLPPSITVNANLDPALSGLNKLMNRIDTSVGTVTVEMLANGSVGSIKGDIAARAGGGPVDPDTTYIVGENGPEIMQFGASGYITPTDMLHPASLGAAVGAGSAGGGTTVVNNFNFYPGVMLGDEMAFTDAIQQAMARLGNTVPDQWASIQSTRGR